VRNGSDDASESELSEASQDCLNRIQILTGYDVNLSEAKISLEGLRHVIHTPKDGRIISDHKNYL